MRTYALQRCSRTQLGHSRKATAATHFYKCRLRQLGPLASLSALPNEFYRSQMQQAATTSTLGGDFRITAPNIDENELPETLKKECFLFYTPDTAVLAHKIAAVSPKVQLGEIRWGYGHIHIILISCCW